MKAKKHFVTAPSVNEQTITSLEIAKLTGKNHRDLMRSIRKQEVAWEKVQERKFAFMFKIRELPNGGHKKEPYYEFTKLESLYIISKYNDEVRARLVKRWYDLENHKLAFAKPRKTVKGVPRLPYSNEEKRVINFIRENLLSGDYGKISKQTGYSRALISLVLNGKHTNHRILKEAYRVAVDNEIQQKKNATSNYDIDFINDAVETINQLKLGL